MVLRNKLSDAVGCCCNWTVQVVVIQIGNYGEQEATVMVRVLVIDAHTKLVAEHTLAKQTISSGCSTYRVCAAGVYLLSSVIVQHVTVVVPM